MNDLGLLSQCLVDGDVEGLSRARCLRRKALGISVILETALVLAVLVWPLLTPGLLHGKYIFTPTPPYPGGTSTGPVRPHGRPHSSTANHRPIDPTKLYQPPTIPTRPPNSMDVGEPLLDTGPNDGAGGGPGSTGSGPLIPWATGSGPAQFEIPPPVHPTGPVHISAGVMDASLIHRVQPVYPPVARAMHLAGTVQLRAIIGKNGRVESLEILSGHPLLTQAAVAAVREWRYQPTRLSGEAVEVVTYITVNFVLQ